MPSTKSWRSGTCASTLLPMSRSAPVPSATSSDAVATPKKRIRVGIPIAFAASATFAAGSIPSTGTPASLNQRSR